MGVLLLIGVISFLSVSAVFLVNDDKRAYIYQSQATEAVMVGREFSNKARRVIDVLRLALASFDPAKPVTPSELNVFKGIVANQSDAATVMVKMIDPETGKDQTLAESESAKTQIQRFQELSPAVFLALMPELRANAYAFVNLSKPGESTVLGVIVADTQFTKKQLGLPVAVGVLSLTSFVQEMQGLNVTIATRTGHVLYDADPGIMFGTRDALTDPLFQAAAARKLTTGATEYVHREKDYLGSYVHADLNLVVLDKIEKSKALRATYALTEKFILLGTMSIALSVIMMILFAKTLTAPINRLYQATREVAKGNFEINLPLTGQDEIGALSVSFTAMSRQISGLIQERMDKLRMENDLAIASTVQQTLIPPAYFENDSIRIHSHYRSANECGGDWWGFFGVGHRMTLMIADATGHGLPSALMTASARSCVSVLHKLAQEDPDFSFSPAAMLRFLNRVIFDASLGRIMMTFFCITIDFKEMTMSYSNAGHNPVWLFRKEGEAYSLQSLALSGARLGEAREAEDFQEKTVPIQQGDLLFLYTDGILEGMNPDKVMYGKKRLRRLVESQLAQGPEKIVSVLMADFQEFNTATKALDDDITLAVAEILAPNASPVDSEPYAQA
ncbi:MAG: hypothetical protein A2070_00585 [Bdellovibrionales bacterium GWC1_52_8]|nr:MAG: hypothetical protein A2070_00585 [Bdellovibrionales bacterium GWC1_52_8]